ncbi:ATPase [Bradyrhizobium centrolobii]|uniref:ATPase n=1 Tax=Bradyrhizobium centrolobii TaxID=1505087 RepID=A0A176YK22_9BRAD|nr:SRPBCC family protein [Bradyrhizobium centrolobii]OAF06400.1 ATPase [Bradyrhizobium centrolobii]OAF07628.1 ATPase [Bradyrhizobium centrolobii]
MSKPNYVYVTYIETSPEALWQALTDGDFTERYWFGHRITSDWTEGAPYRFTNNGNPTVEGEVITFDPTRRLAYSWHNRKPEAAGEGISRVTFDLEARGKVVKLTVTHDELGEDGKTLRDISGGWPMVLSNLKSMLETGHTIGIVPPSYSTKDAA